MLLLGEPQDVPSPVHAGNLPAPGTHADPFATLRDDKLQILLYRPLALLQARASMRRQCR